jgi:hypothetical protein
MACSRSRDAQYILVVAENIVEARRKVDAMPNRVPYIRNRPMQVIEIPLNDHGVAVLTTIIG